MRFNECLNIFFIVCISLILIFNCTTHYPKYTHQTRVDKKLIPKAILIRIEGFENTSFEDTPLVNLKLQETLPEIEDVDSIKNFQAGFEGKARNASIEMELYEGKYYGTLSINDSMIYPFLFTNSSNLKIHFGFSVEKKVNFFSKDDIRIIEFTDDKCKKIDFKTLICPALQIDDDYKFQANFRIHDTRFSPEGTALIWLAGLHFYPIGVIIPVILGPIGFEREITQHKLDELK